MCKNPNQETIISRREEHYFADTEGNKYPDKFRHMFVHYQPNGANVISEERIIAQAKTTREAKEYRTIINSRIPNHKGHLIAERYIVKALGLPGIDSDNPLKILEFVNAETLRAASLQLKSLIAKEETRRFPRLHGVWLIQNWRFRKVLKAIHARVKGS